MKLSYRLFSMVSALAVVIATFGSSQPVLASAPARPALTAGDVIPGQLVVGFSGSPTMNASAQASALAGTVSAQVAKVQGNLALLNVAPSADLNALATQIQGQVGVSFAEPNYVYTIPEQSLGTKPTPSQTTFVIRRAPLPATMVSLAGHKGSTINTPRGGLKQVAIPIQNLQAMKTIGPGNKIAATYPNDKYFLSFIKPWDFVGASIVWANTTASAGICEIDTGVDYLHPDLTGKITKGYDFVNADIDPMDDDGHGTHVAGIMVARTNNALGIAGVSTGMVVAVKALDAQGNGTSYDIAQAINYCARRTDVKVINLSLGGPTPSTAIHDALVYATTNTTYLPKKLIVAAAGNGDASTGYVGIDSPIYPAFYANQSITGSQACQDVSVTYPTQCPVYPEFSDGAGHDNKVLAVAASGDDNDDYTNIASYSYRGSWISVVAPGTDITSTLPYDKPFYLNTFYSYNTRYDAMSGTSMAAPYVSAVAARYWGYNPTFANTKIATDIITAKNSGNFGVVTADNPSGFPPSMSNVNFANVALMLDRGAVKAYADDASAGTPLNGATVQLFRGTAATVLGTGIITPSTSVDPSIPIDPTRVWTIYTDEADILNVTTDFTNNTIAKVNKVGYTAAAQDAFRKTTNVYGGLWSDLGTAYVPPKTANFDFVTSWIVNERPDLAVHVPTTSTFDLDTNLWLPAVPNPMDGAQWAGYIVGPEGATFGYTENDPRGTLGAFPFARMKREGGATDWLQVEDTTVLNRVAAHGTMPVVPANAAQAFFPGSYAYQVTDMGQTIDQDLNGTTDPIPLMGVYYTPLVIIWKDGLIKKLDGPNVTPGHGVPGAGPGLAAMWLNLGDQVDPAGSPNGDCNVHSWQPFIFTVSVATGLPHIYDAGSTLTPPAQGGYCGVLPPYTAGP